MGMQSRRDQVLAYRFQLRRRHAALLAGDPDSAEAPLRKLGAATMGSLMVATLAVAGAGIAGVVSPGHATSWKDGKAVIIEKETGGRFYYDKQHGVLRHVLNYTSARLLLAQSGWQTVSVSARSLAGVPRGLDIGIAGAPDELPGPAGVVGLPWTVCSLPAASADSRTYTEAAIGGSTPAAVGAAAPLGDKALLAQRPDDSLWLVWHNRRLRVRGGPDDASGRQALAQVFGTAPAATDVTDAWLDTVQPGPDLAAPVPSGVPDGTGPAVGGHQTRIGQVVRVQNPGQTDRWYLVQDHGLKLVTRVQAALAAGAYPAAGGELTVATTDLAGAAVDDTPADVQLPASPPALVDTAALGTVVACTVFTDQAGLAPGAVTVAPVVQTALTQISGTTPAPQEKPGVALADFARIPPDKVAVVRELPPDGSTSGALFLITGYGDYAVKFPVTNQATLVALGFKGVAPLPVAPSLLAMLHTGMRLDAADAALEVPPAGAATATTGGS